MTELHVLYRFFDTEDNLLYVGITNSPLARMSQHLRDKASKYNIMWLPEEIPSDFEIAKRATEESK